MTAERSAYAVLGLKPGARRADVDEAYRRLMKEHHPDRTGGDGSRAAEINRAYTLIRRDLPAAMQRARRVPVPTPAPPRRRRSGRGVLVLALAAGAIAIGAFASDELGRKSGRTAYPVRLEWFDRMPEVPASAGVTTGVEFGSPLHSAVIATAIEQAERFHEAADMPAATEYSRECHNRLRQDPNLALFDACAAFDESTLVLSFNQPQTDSGPFAGSEVTARELAAVRALSGDVLDADSRLHQIRSIVELRLLPKLDAAAGQPKP
jgi:hypothetical protein